MSLLTMFLIAGGVTFFIAVFVETWIAVETAPYMDDDGHFYYEDDDDASTD